MRLLYRNYLYEAVNINKEYLLKLANGDATKLQDARSKALKIVQDTHMNPPEKDSQKIQALLAKFILQNELPNGVTQFLHDLINENKINIFYKLNSDSSKQQFEDLISEFNSTRMTNTGDKLSSEESCIWLRTKVYHDFGDGYKWVIALGPDGEPIGYMPSAITQKTNRHCGGQPSHVDGDVYYGLRDANNKEHVTVIIDKDNRVKEAKGFNNQTPRNKAELNKYMQWLLLHPDVKGVSYDNGYARHMNYGVSQMSDDDEFISKIEKEKPQMIHPDVDRPILNWKKMIKSGEADEQDLINAYIGCKQDECDNPLMLEHLIGILGKNPFSEEKMIDLIMRRYLDAIEIGNAGTQYLTIPIQHALMKHNTQDNIKALIEIYNEVPNNKIDIGYILNTYPDSLYNVKFDKRLEAAKAYIPAYESKANYYKGNIIMMFWEVYNSGDKIKFGLEEEQQEKLAILDDFLAKSGKVNLNRRNSNGEAIIFNILKYIPLLKMALNNGLDPNLFFSSRGGTVLQSIIYNTKNPKEHIKLLNNPRTNINNQHDLRRETLLSFKIRTGSTSDDTIKDIRVVLEHHPRLDIVNEEGYTALTQSLQTENLEVTKMLLDAGADVNQKTPHGTALDMAAKMGNRKFLRLLEEYEDVA